MRNPFQRARRGADTATLGSATLALRLAGALPPGCVGVAVDPSGRTTRLADGAQAPQGAWCFHPGPYSTDLTPFAAAPELGLRLRFAIDSADPLVPQQRFDLYLASEGHERLALADFAAALEEALQRALAQGNLDLPPCTQPDEWNAFRAGLNELFYTRFGVTIDDCIPVDLAGARDFATMLAARAVDAAPLAPGVAVAPMPVIGDADALRRLFLELPALLARVRLLDAAGGAFARQRALVQRLDHVGLSVLTMPALELAAPGVPVSPAVRQHRARHAARALSALDEAWALLARAGALEAELLFDEFERVLANLEHDTAARRAVEIHP